MRLILCLLCGFVLTIQACKHDPIYPHGLGADSKDTTKTFSSNCNSDTVYFRNTIQPLITSSCASQGCHSAASREKGIDLSSYSAIMNSDIIDVNKPEKSELYDVITKTNSEDAMPPNAPLSLEQTESILKWIQQGARNNGCKGACDTLDVTFANSIMPIINTNCKSCHSGSSPNGGILLTNYTEIKASVDANQLYQSLTGANGLTLMPYGSDTLSKCDIRTFKIWIDQGAPNN